jgi:hypothetical protein
MGHWRYSNGEKSGTLVAVVSVTMDEGGKKWGGGEGPVNVDDDRSRRKYRCKKNYFKKNKKEDWKFVVHF